MRQDKNIFISLQFIGTEGPWGQGASRKQQIHMTEGGNRATHAPGGKERREKDP